MLAMAEAKLDTELLMRTFPGSASTWTARLVAPPSESGEGELAWLESREGRKRARERAWEARSLPDDEDAESANDDDPGDRTASPGSSRVPPGRRARAPASDTDSTEKDADFAWPPLRIHSHTSRPYVPAVYARRARSLEDLVRGLIDESPLPTVDGKPRTFLFRHELMCVGVGARALGESGGAWDLRLLIVPLLLIASRSLSFSRSGVLSVPSELFERHGPSFLGHDPAGSRAFVDVLKPSAESSSAVDVLEPPSGGARRSGGSSAGGDAVRSGSAGRVSLESPLSGISLLVDAAFPSMPPTRVRFPTHSLPERVDVRRFLTVYQLCNRCTATRFRDKSPHPEVIVPTDLPRFSGAELVKFCEHHQYIWCPGFAATGNVKCLNIGKRCPCPKFLARTTYWKHKLPSRKSIDPMFLMASLPSPSPVSDTSSSPLSQTNTLTMGGAELPSKRGRPSAEFAFDPILG